MFCEKILFVVYWILDVGVLIYVFPENLTRKELFSFGINLPS